MATPLLSTKLYIPALHKNLVPRSRLIKRLKEGMAGRLTLVSAPAGYGKTTLVCEWLAHANFPAVWLSLDSNDNDLATFLTYFITALQQLHEGIGAEVIISGETIMYAPNVLTPGARPSPGRAIWPMLSSPVPRFRQL